MSKKLPLNRVGHYVPDAPKATIIADAIQVIQDESTQMGPALNVKERAKLSKPRIGYEPIVVLIARLADQHNVVSRHTSTQEIRKDLDLVKTTEPIVQNLAVVYNGVKDIHRQGRSEAWESALVFYSISRRWPPLTPC